MTIPSSESLAASKCVPCEGGVPRITSDQAPGFANAVPDWTISEDHLLIERKVNCKTFMKAIKLMNEIAEIAESQQHHPDLHLTGYRHLSIQLTTHAIGGLSENDFIVAAHIDRLACFQS